jgi:protein-L-isoaspartate(D-aspartate) O-methyltransferase
MVESQIARRGVADQRVLDAMRVIPRHCFVPESLRESAYEDRPLEIGWGQTISQPYIVAFMTQLLELKPEDRVLEVGTGSGYQSAVLGSLVHSVVTIERVEELGDLARQRLDELGFENVTVVTGDGTLGCPEHGPYDAIIVTAAGPHIPEPLKHQLRDGGRLVCPVGPRESQRLIRIVREGDRYREETSIGCVFVPLIGEDGWAL